MTDTLPEHDPHAHLLIGEETLPEHDLDITEFHEDDYSDEEVDLDPDLQPSTGGPDEVGAASWYPAPCIGSLQRDLDTRFPGRTKPDWILGDAAHSARESDHNPDSGGMVHAIDIRLGGGLDPQVVLDAVIGDSRVWYVIYNRIIYSRTYDWAARAYTGASPHTDHVHVSFRYLHSAEQDTSTWRGLVKKVRPKRIDLSVVRREFLIATGHRKGKVAPCASVRRVQHALNHRIGAGLVADGKAGPQTVAAWTRWESRKNVPGRHRSDIPDRLSLTALVEPKWKVVA